MHKRIKNNTQTYIIAWHSIMAKSCFPFFFFTILLNIFLIINPYQLCFGKWVLFKCDDWLIILGNTSTLQHNVKRDITLIFTIYGREDSFSQFTLQNSFQFFPAQAVAALSRPTANVFPLWSCSMLPHSILQTLNCWRHYVTLLKPTPIMDGSSWAFPKPYILKKSPK